MALALLLQPHGFESLLLGVEHLPADDLLMAHRKDERDLDLEGCATAFSTPSLACIDEHAVADFSNVQNLNRPVVPNTDPFGHDLEEALVSAIVAYVRLVWELRDDDVGRSPVEHCRLVATEVCVQRRLHHINVLPRHRLLCQPHGFECCLLVVELPVAGDLACADGEDHIVAGTHARSAGLAAPALARDNK